MILCPKEHVCTMPMKDESVHCNKYTIILRVTCFLYLKVHFLILESLSFKYLNVQSYGFFIEVTK